MFGITRRTLYRALFLGLCVLPTCAMTAWAAWAQSPLYREFLRQQWQTALSLRLGLPVEIRAAERGPGGAVRLEGVRVVDSEQNRVIADARFLELEPDGRGWVAVLSAPRAAQADVRRLFESWQEHGLRRASTDFAEVVWLATDATLESPAGSVTLSEVHGAFEKSKAGPRLVLEMTLAGGAPSLHARLTVTRDRQAAPARTVWRFEALDQAVPTSVLPDVFPELTVLGDRCEFQGIAEFQVTSRAAAGTLTGQLRNIDLDRWTERLPHKLSGLADLELRHTRITDGRLLEAEGLLTSRGGIVSRSFLLTTASEETLGMQVADRVRSGKDVLWRYQQLAIEFSLSPDGLQLSGRCPDQPAGTLLSDARGPLVQDSPHAVVPAVALVRSLAPANQVLVPAGSETDSILRHLPLPSLTPPTPIAERPLSPKVRLR